MNIRYPIYEGVYRILTFELFFVFPFGTIPYRKADYFSAHGIGGKCGQGGNGKYALQRRRRGRFSGCKRQRSLSGLAAGNRTLQKQ